MTAFPYEISLIATAVLMHISNIPIHDGCGFLHPLSQVPNVVPQMTVKTMKIGAFAALVLS